jgi:hypothetical protein
MATLTAILGLCGSGKSYRAKHMDGVEVFGESLYAKLPELYAALNGGKDSVVTEIQLVQAHKRAEFVRLLDAHAPGTKVVWVPIENEVEKANRNCRRPERKAEKPNYDPEAHVRMNEHYTRVYEYPDSVPVEEMWSCA